MFFNQIPPQGGPAQMPAQAVPPQAGAPMPPGMPSPGMPPGMPPPMMPPPQGIAPQQGQQGTPGLNILKLLMMMKNRGNGPMSGGIGSAPPPSLGMPYSLSANGSGSGQSDVYSLIAKILGSNGQQAG